MRKRMLLLFLAFVVVLVALPAMADVECYEYIDSRAYSDRQYNFCWLSGNICYQCVDSGRGTGCASDWTTCDPNPRIVPFMQVVGCPASSTPAANPRIRPARIERIAHLKTANLL